MSEEQNQDPQQLPTVDELIVHLTGLLSNVIGSLSNLGTSFKQLEKALVAQEQRTAELEKKYAVKPYGRGKKVPPKGK